MVFKNHITLAVFTILAVICPNSSLAFEATASQIREAELNRRIGKELGLDDLSEKALFLLLDETSKEKQDNFDIDELSDQEKEVTICCLREYIKLFFHKKIEILVRYLNDKEFEKKMDKKIEIMCGLHPQLRKVEPKNN